MTKSTGIIITQLASAYWIVEGVPHLEGMLFANYDEAHFAAYHQMHSL